jgi:serine/threonine-protein kinase HipA
MRTAAVLFRDEQAGVIAQNSDGSFVFTYLDYWLCDASKPSISPAFPKSRRAFFTAHLFPFFYSMLPEGSNREWLCRKHRLDLNDDFGLLMISACNDSIGAVRVVPVSEHQRIKIEPL